MVLRKVATMMWTPSGFEGVDERELAVAIMARAYFGGCIGVAMSRAGAENCLYAVFLRSDPVFVP